jgi:hypothetical protein
MHGLSHQFKYSGGNCEWFDWYEQGRQCTYNVTLSNLFCSRKAISITNSEILCLALSIQHAMRFHHIAICSPPGSIIFFSNYLIKARFSKKVTEYSLHLPETLLVWSKTERGMTKKVYWSSLKLPVSFVTFNEPWTSSTLFRKILNYEVSSTFVQCEPSCSMQTDGQTRRS